MRDRAAHPRIGEFLAAMVDLDGELVGDSFVAAGITAMPGTAPMRARSVSGTAEKALSWIWFASSAAATAARSGSTR
jgi:hypothetical protein